MGADSQTRPSTDRAISRVRTRLTLWYAGTFTVILALLGLGLFLMVRRQLSRALDDSLSAATLELTRVVGAQEVSQQPGDSTLLRAIDELRIPQRTLYLLHSDGRPIVPTEADRWIRVSAASAGSRGHASARYDTDDDRTLRLGARRFRTASGRTLVAAAIADQYELEDRYTALIGAFAAATLVAILLVAVGGWILARQFTAPIEANFANMRRFMADAAHQLKTPIAILRANADVALQRTRDADGYRLALKSVETESNRLGAIVDRMLVLARADAGAGVPERRRVFLDDIVSDCIAAAAPMARKNDVRIEFSSFEETAVNADPELVRELVMILLDNAIKYTPRGGTVDVSLDTPSGNPTLVVSDNGEGVSAADMPFLFDRFYRGDQGGNDHEGAGLGLSIARWIADEHGASLSVRSVRGEGCAFTAAFPPPA